MRNDIHHYERRLNGALTRLEKLKMNKEHIRNFVRQCKIEELSSGKIAKYVNNLIIISRILRKDFKKVTRKDIENLILFINKQNYTEWTKQGYKICLKKFWKWLKRSETYPKEVSWIKTTIKNNNKKLPNEILTKEEINKMIKITNQRNRALVITLYEGGLRIGELCNLRVKDIEFNDKYCMLNIIGKTGNRKVPVFECVSSLKSWINYANLSREDYLFNIGYRRIVYILRDLAKECNIDKPINPHAFRHARASHLASRLTQSQLCQYFGWTQGSNMAQVYVHLTGKDLIPDLIKGIQTKSKKCYKCNEENEPSLQFCSKCLMPLDQKTYQDKMKEDIVDSAIKEVIKKKNLENEIMLMIKDRLKDRL